jgi:hypothetical protein
MATRHFRNARGRTWGISATGKRVTEFWSARDGSGGPRSKNRELSSNAEATRLMKSRIAEKLKEGFVDEKELRARQRDARKALNDRMAVMKAQAAGRKADVSVRRRPQPKRGSPAGAETRSKVLPPPPLPPSYKKCIERYGSDTEFERKVDPVKRRSPRRPGYPPRLTLYSQSRLVKARKLFTKSLIPATDLKQPHDHANLLPFGDDTERTWICWDPSSRKPNGEMKICFIDGDQGDQRTDAGYDLEKVLSAYRQSRSN